MPLPVPVRQLHDDGFITVRYLMPDGTEPQDDLPEEMALGAMLHPITAVWDNQYRLGIIEGVFPNSKTQKNLLHLSNTDPLLFEEVLDFLESAPDQEQRLMAHRVTGNSMFPNERRPQTTFHEQYRAIMRSAPVLVELCHDKYSNWGTQTANQILGDARKSVEGFDHPHFIAAAVATWIMQKHDGKRTRIAYADHADGIAYIDDNMRAVMDVRDDLARIGTLNKDDIESVIRTASVLRIGAL